jgi:hypothetical protein
VQDRLSGIVGQIGLAPASAQIMTDFTSPDTGVSRVGTTEAIHTWGWWMESIVWSHVWSNFAAVYQRYPGPGSSSMEWTIEGIADGVPFTVENRGMFYSDYDATMTLYKLLSTIDYLQFNEFTEGINRYTKVTFTSIESSGMITEQQREGDIVNVRTSSSLEPKLKSRAVTKVKAGSTLTVEVTLAPVDGSPEVVTTMDVKIPHSAKGYHTFTVRGGKDRPWFRLGDVYSFEELVAQLSGGEHRNDLIVSGPGRGGVQELDWMPKGRYYFDVQVA